MLTMIIKSIGTLIFGNCYHNYGDWHVVNAKYSQSTSLHLITQVKVCEKCGLAKFRKEQI